MIKYKMMLLLKDNSMQIKSSEINTLILKLTSLWLLKTIGSNPNKLIIKFLLSWQKANTIVKLMYWIAGNGSYFIKKQKDLFYRSKNKTVKAT